MVPAAVVLSQQCGGTQWETAWHAASALPRTLLSTRSAEQVVLYLPCHMGEQKGEENALEGISKTEAPCVR